MQLKAEDELTEQINHLARKVKPLEIHRVDIGGSYVELEPKILVSYDQVLAKVYAANV